jgi:biopolymer transport protein ExbD
MGMNVGNEGGEEDTEISAINTTPLVDVMLVLLIIFLITIPVVTHTVPVKIPKEENTPRKTKPENIEISVTRDGDVFWNLEYMKDNDVLLDRLKKIAVRVPQPEVHIRGDAEARYAAIGKVVYDCQRSSIMKVSFVTEPPMRGG